MKLLLKKTRCMIAVATCFISLSRFSGAQNISSLPPNLQKIYNTLYDNMGKKTLKTTIESLKPQETWGALDFWTKE